MIIRRFFKGYLSSSHHSSKPLLLRCKPSHIFNERIVPFTPKYQIHTSSHLNALPPVLWMLMKPVFKLTAALTGRGFRRWWKLLPTNKKAYFIQVIKARKYLIGGAISGLSLLPIGFYISHLQETPITQRKRFLAFTPSQFQEIAELEFKTICEKYKANVISASNPATRRVLRVTDRLLNSNKDIPQVNSRKWAITVVDDPTENAFVLPSGHIFVCTGMLTVCENDDQLGTVLGHEISHAILEHGHELVSYGHLLDLAMVVVIGALWTLLPTDGISLLFQYFSKKTTELLMHLPYNRMLENEADEVGLHLAAKACFDVRESSAFWKKMEIRSTMKGEVEIEWLSTHPTHGNRSDSLDQLIPKALEVRSQSRCLSLPCQDPRREVLMFKKAMQDALKIVQN